MWADRFDPRAPDIRIPVRLFGRFGARDFEFLLDTGTSVSIVDTDIVHALGYSALAAKRTLRLHGVGEPEECFVLDVDRLDAMGRTHTPCELVCQDLPMGVAGLVGLDLLRGRTLTIDFAAGDITVTP